MQDDYYVGQDRWTVLPSVREKDVENLLKLMFKLNVLSGVDPHDWYKAFSIKSFVDRQWKGL